MCWYWGVCLVLILVPCQSCARARKKRVALTCWRNLQIFLSSVSPLPPFFPVLPSLFFTVFSPSRSPRTIHQRKSTGVLAFPFFGCSNELVVSLVTFPFSYASLPLLFSSLSAPLLIVFY